MEAEVREGELERKRGEKGGQSFVFERDKLLSGKINERETGQGAGGGGACAEVRRDHQPQSKRQACETLAPNLTHTPHSSGSF